MKKLLVGVILIILFIIEGVFAIRINEVESNPSGKDGGNEWVELYSDEEIDLDGWKLVNNDEDVIELDQVFQEYLVIEFETQWLDNEDEKVSLYYDSELVDETDLFSDTDNDDKTLSYCDGDWVFAGSTKELVNFCEKDEELNEEEIINSNILESEIGELKRDSYDEETNEDSGLEENEIIQIGKVESPKTEDIKTTKNIIYESKSELIKKYSVFGFALLCVALSVLLIWNKLN